MKNVSLLVSPLLILLLSLPAFVKGQSSNPQGNSSKVPFSFTLAEKAATSAGVFLQDGTLVRTLWGGRKFNAGKHTKVWDGLDDEGLTVDNGQYTIKVLSNNVTYTWEGVVGNTSDAFNAATLYHSYERVHDMAIAGNNIYMAIGYDEQGTPGIKSTTTNPQACQKLLAKGAVSYYVATDGTNVYWSAEDFYHQNNHWVYVTKVSDNKENILDKSKPMTSQYGMTYSSGIDIVNNTSGHISGIAVQQSGEFLFVSHGSLNEIHVINKKTGAIVQTISINNPRKLAVDNKDNLWVSNGENSITKYEVGNSGKFSAPLADLQGLVEPLSMAVSPDGSTITVLDGGASQQVKAFDNNTGSPAWIFGEEKGYATDATVKDNKFIFFDQTYVAYQPDGTFWVGDVGNFRSQHFTGDRKFIDRIMYLPASYSSGVDANNITRVFSDYLEFSVDYSKPLGGTNGSWTLVKNWVTPITGEYDEQFNRMKGVVTLSNGRTYATLMKLSTNVREVVELPATGNLRFTGVTFPNDNTQLYPDGSLRKQTTILKGSPTIWTQRTLTGFDGSNNPVWGPEEVIAKSPNATDKDPLYWGNPSTLTSGERTSTNLVISFDGGLTPNGSTGYHLGAIKEGESKWLWRTAKSTHPEYDGPYPADGAYDIGNSVQYAGIKALALDRSIIWGYHGEFWKASQTNKYNHVYDNGLFIGQFGTTGVENGLFVPGPGNAGNALSPVLVKDADGNMYMYHSDESYHSGVHRWKIADLNSIKEQSIEVKYPASPNDTLPLEGVDLMEGLPYNKTLKNNTNGWTRYPEEENHTDKYSNYWTVKTSVKSYDKLQPTDVYAHFRKLVSVAYVNRSLGENSGLESWDLSGIISWDGNNGNNIQALTGGAFFQVLDNKGKVIAQMYYDKFFWGDPYCAYYGNNELIAMGKAGEMQRVFDKGQPFSIVFKGDSLTITYADYLAVTIKNSFDTGANMQNPAAVRLYFKNADANYDRKIDVESMRFFANEKKNESIFSNFFRSATSGNWNDVSTWESSSDNQTWFKATLSPDSAAGKITIRNGHSVSLEGILTVDQLTINDGGVLNVLPNAAIIVNDGEGNDIAVAAGGKMIIKSNAEGTGRIGKSTGLIKGDVTVERFLPAKSFATYRMLAPSVNTSSSIKNNWQEGVNNLTFVNNIDPAPGYGTHITGSLPALNGFDATLTARPSLLTFNQAAPAQNWVAINNTNVNKLDAKKGYLLFTLGDRSINPNDISAESKNTTLRATGSILGGTVNYSALEGNGRNSVITNPYASPIDWLAMQEANSTEFENYYTFWDPNVGSKGGYVTVDATGTTSVRTSAATTVIQSGQAFMVKAKQGITLPTFAVEEAHKSETGNANIFRTSGAVVSKLYASLYYTDENGNRTLADGMLSRFDENYVGEVDGDDAEDIANFDENISFERSGKSLSIESRPLAQDKDTLFLSMSNMKQQAYEWQFDASDFDPTVMTQAFLRDRYLGTEIPIELEGSTVIIIAITADRGSVASDRFYVVFEKLKTLPVKMLAVSAAEYNTGIKVEWKTANEVNMDRYEVERSADGQTFSLAATVKATGTATSINNYNWLDSHPKGGYNYYRIASVSKDGSVEYSVVVRVLISQAKEAINIFPNPVKGGSLSVRLNNLQQGSYTLRLLNMAGQTLFTRRIQSSGGSAAQTETINANNFAAGMYRVQLQGDNFNYSQQLIKL